MDTTLRIIARSIRHGLAFASALLVTHLSAQNNYATPYTVTTLATGLSGPAGVAVDSSGNVFVANVDGNSIDKIAPDGMVTTIAGVPLNPPTPSSYKDGSGLTATFNGPWGIAIDSAGNLYVSDSGNNAIRKITPPLVPGVTPWMVSTVATSGPGGATGPGAMNISNPTGITVDSSGNIYFTNNNYTIAMVTQAGVVTTVAGQAGDYGSADGVGQSALFGADAGMAIDDAGNLYVADTSNNTIRKITPTTANGITTWAASTLAGTAGVKGSADGTGSAAQFNAPYGVAVDSAGNVYVADSNNQLIRKITPAGVVSTVAGTAGSKGSLNGNVSGTGGAALLYNPYGLAADGAGDIYVANKDLLLKGSPISGVSIATQPVSQTVAPGSSVVLTTVAYGNQPLTYQWYLNGSPISQATSPTLSISNVTAANAGTYTVSVTGSGGTTQSNAAVLTVSSAVALSPITTQPVSQTINTGSSVVFTVVTGGSGATYQWQFNGTNLSDGNGISGSAGPQLVIQGASAADVGNYACVVTSGGVAVTSDAASLQVATLANPGSLVAIAARGNVGTGEAILIGGFYIVGNSSRTVLIQGLGPALSGVGVVNVLKHPAVFVYDDSGKMIYSNSGWSSQGSTQSQILLDAAQAAGAQPVLQSGSADSEVLVTLPPGGYTAEVTGADGGTGIALCAIYQMP